MSYNLAEIDTEALRHNIRYIRSQIGPKRKIMASVKANGYGMGVMPMCQILLDEDVESFGVAICEEGIQLREGNIERPILLYGATPKSDFLKAIHYDLSLSIYTFEAACFVDFVGRQMGKKAKVHIKLDTGMHRLGFPLTEKSLGEIKVISEMPHIELEGIMSHLGQTDNNPDYTNHQIAQFKEFVATLAAAGVEFPLHHLANSFGILRYPESHLDLVRPGIMLHGCGIPKESRGALRQVLTLKSAVVRLYQAAPGDEISYGGTYKAPSERLIATIPLGYADGYTRALSSRAYVLIKGQRAPITGRICMDQFMVDVTDIDGVKIGDEVVLYGSQGDETIYIDDLADLIDTVPNEILTSLGQRVPKAYIFEDDD